MLFYRDKLYNFFEVFNQKNGSLLRSGVINNGELTATPPPMRAFPELVDVGIMGKCHAAKHGLCRSFGIDCYQNGHINDSRNMSLDGFKKILNQCKNRVYQLVFGGAGDPVKHENLLEILKLTRESGIVPNLTTTGYMLTDYEASLLGEYCGAVAVSYYSRLDSCFNETSAIPLNAIKKLRKSNCKVNVHYVLSKETIRDAIVRLKNNLFPEDINGVVFLMYKAVGEGIQGKVLSMLDDEYLTLLNTVQRKKFNFRIGFDTCQTPALRHFCSDLSQESIESCESARFSMYIHNDLMAYPCSFACHDAEFQLDLSRMSIVDAWNSPAFSNFRKKQEIACSGCHQTRCYKCVLESNQSDCPSRLI